MPEHSLVQLNGPVLIAPDEVADQAWVLGGRITFDRPSGALDAPSIDGWVLPGLVDAHCHVGLAATGAVDAATQERQISTDRDAGTLLIRDAGSPADTRWIDDRADLPRLIRAGTSSTIPS